MPAITMMYAQIKDPEPMIAYIRIAGRVTSKWSLVRIMMMIMMIRGSH